MGPNSSKQQKVVQRGFQQQSEPTLQHIFDFSNIHSI